MAKEHAIERTIEILQQSDDIDLLPRVVRLYGTFAIDCSGTLSSLSKCVCCLTHIFIQTPHTCCSLTQRTPQDLQY